MEPITSSQNSRIKRLLKLHTSRGRQQQGRVVVFGEREVLRAIESGIEPDELFVDADSADELSDSLARFNKSIYSLPADLFAKVRFGGRDGVIMTASRPQSDLSQLSFARTDGRAPLIGIVEAVEKPGNLGAMMRTADGAGLDALIVCDAITDWYHPNSIRSSLGACFSLDGCVSSNELVQQWLAEGEFEVFLAALSEESTSLFDMRFDPDRPTAIVLGNEAAGLSAAWTDQPYAKITIPMHGISDSLNVSTSAAILFYEAVRQRKTGKAR